MRTTELPAFGAMELSEQTKFFSGLNATQLEKIAAICRSEVYSEGSEIYHLGEPAEDFYVLIDGMVRFTIGLGARKASAGEIIHRGEVFGWAALIEGAPNRTATAFCLTECSLLAIKGTDLLELMENDMRTGYLIMKRLNVLINGHLTAFASG